MKDKEAEMQKLRSDLSSAEKADRSGLEAKVR